MSVTFQVPAPLGVAKVSVILNHCNNNDCHRANCTQIASELSCKHSKGAWALRPDGGHVLEKAVLNEIGDTMYFVCSCCHLEKFNLLGLPVIINNKDNNGNFTFDLDNPEHVSRLIPHLRTVITPINERTVLVNPGNGHIDPTGIPRTAHATSRINITRKRISPTKRITVAKAMQYVIERGDIEVSAEERKAIYTVIGEERSSVTKRKQRQRAITKAKLRV